MTHRALISAKSFNRISIYPFVKIAQNILLTHIREHIRNAMMIKISDILRHTAIWKCEAMYMISGIFLILKTEISGVKHNHCQYWHIALDLRQMWKNSSWTIEFYVPWTKTTRGKLCFQTFRVVTNTLFWIYSNINNSRYWLCSFKQFVQIHRFGARMYCKFYYPLSSGKQHILRALS